MRNAYLHTDLKMEMVTNEIEKFAKKHEEGLLHHVNVEAIQVLDNSELARRLNLLTPNVNYSGRTAPITSKVAFYIFIQQI